MRRPEKLRAICEVRRVTTGSQQNVMDVQMPKRRDGLIERELPEELILYDPEIDRAFLLNHTSTAIWDLCDGQSALRQIAEQIALCFSAPAEKVVEDVRATIERFHRDRLLAPP